MKICVVVAAYNEAILNKREVNNPNITFMPVFGALTGHRFDLIISPESAYDPSLYNKNIQWINEVLKTKLSVDGKIVFV